jgi:hypothetical protein
MRGETKKRPQGSDRFTSQIMFQNIPADDSPIVANQKLLEPSNSMQRKKTNSSQASLPFLKSNNWLAEQWRAQSKQAPTLRQIIDGILYEVQIQVQLQWKDASQQQKLKAMDSRAKTWLLYFKIFGFTNHIELDQPLPLE